MIKTLILSAKDEKTVLVAADIIKNGGLVAIPTETVYGLGANGLDEKAVGKIFAAKGRPQDNPLILHLASAAELDRYCVDVPAAARLLAERFWPGPLTLVLKAGDLVPGAAIAGLDTVAVRCPDCAVTRAVIERACVPVAAPSANTSGRPSPTTAAHVLEDMGGKIDAIVDAGPCCVGVESTIIDLSEDRPRLLRPGGLPVEAVEAVIGPVVRDKALLGEVREGERVKAPGMKYRHYAPRAQLTAVCGEPDKTAAYIAENRDEKTGVICFDEYAGLFPGAIVRTLGPSGNSGEHARRVFDALRYFDETAVSRIFAQCPPESGLDRAVANRLKKAAGFCTVDV